MLRDGQGSRGALLGVQRGFAGDTAEGGTAPLRADPHGRDFAVTATPAAPVRDQLFDVQVVSSCSPAGGEEWPESSFDIAHSEFRASMPSVRRQS